MARMWDKHKQTDTPLKRKVFAALSGGVDSAVSAYLLKQQGYDVVGVFMRNWSQPDGRCGWVEERADALKVASHLGIPFKTVNFEAEYRRQIVSYLFAEYRAGRTPNPDILCNEKIKFGLYLKWARAHGADMIATGHYARVVRDRAGQFHLRAGLDRAKDQSYFVYRLGQRELAHTLMPVGGLVKPKVRVIAQSIALPVADKPDSQGICFVGKVNMRDFLKSRLPVKPGAILTTDGKKIGEHEGAWFYTIGQRHGLGIGGGVPYFVAQRSVSRNTLTVGVGERAAALYAPAIALTRVHWVSGKPPRLPTDVRVRIRYREPLKRARLVERGKQLVVRYATPERAIAPGQSAVFYRGQEVLGGGIIARALPNER